MTSAQGVCQTKICMLMQIVCLEAQNSAEQLFIDSYFPSEMRVLVDE